MTDAAILAAAGIVTTFLVNYFQERRVNQKFEQQETAAEKRRLWAKQDAEDKATELARKTEEIASDLRQETQKNRAVFREHAAVVEKELKENTKLTGMAYDAANNFEMKLEKLARIFDSVHTDRETMRHLEELSADTNQVVLEQLQPDVEAIKKATARSDKDAG